MSTRGYFEQRNLIPGTVFILFIGAFNFTLVLNLLSQESALIGIVGILLGSPAIGFLVSQMWYWYIQHNYRIYSWAPVTKMVELYQLEKIEKKKVLVMFDYILHHGLHSTHEGLSSYGFRRYDNYVILSVTRLCIVFGTVFGVLIRILRELYPIKAYDFKVLSTNFINSPEFPVCILLTVTIVLLLMFLGKGIQSVKTEYDEMHTAVIIRAHNVYSGVSISRQDLTDVFPDYFK
jgi:hypothetical protein